MLLHDYVEAYLYWSFATDEPESSIQKIWEFHLEQEIQHLHMVKQLLEKYEKKSVEDVMPNGGAFPEPLHFHDTKDYVRKVLAEQVRLTADKETFVPIDDLPTKHEFFTYQELVNKSERNVVSHTIIEDATSTRTGRTTGAKIRKIRWKNCKIALKTTRPLAVWPANNPSRLP